ncbi:MAG: FkbM family methyltransferase [Proteobacteria bacterium]|nr:FkbM family methyltransferase [Pseudomonadota bacterium]
MNRISLKTKSISLVKPLIERLPLIAAMCRGLRDQFEYFTDKSTTTPWGFKLAGNKIMAQGSFEPNETKIVRDLLKNMDILINVGANVGYYCCHALSMGKPVIAFEPIERNLRYLCKNIKDNCWSGAEIYPVALSNSVGIIEIYGGNTGASVVKGWAGIPESYVTLVPSSTMDVVLDTRLRGKNVLVLVDVEGAEKQLLEGATKMLVNDPKPVWLVEITTKIHQPHGVEINPNFKSTFQLFFQNGYQAFNVDQDMSPVIMEHVDLVSSGSLRFATHNFLFCESKATL